MYLDSYNIQPCLQLAYPLTSRSRTVCYGWVFTLVEDSPSLHIDNRASQQLSMLSTLQMLDVLNPPVLKEMGNYLEDEWLNSEHVCLPRQFSTLQRL